MFAPWQYTEHLGSAELLVTMVPAAAVYPAYGAAGLRALMLPVATDPVKFGTVAEENEKPMSIALLGMLFAGMPPVWQASHDIPLAVACRTCAPGLAGAVTPVAGDAIPG